jgi:hypothetical protein
LRDSRKLPIGWLAPCPWPTTASSVLWNHLTSHGRARRLYRLKRFPAVPVAARQAGNPWDLPVLAMEVSVHAWVLRLRRVHRRLAMNRRR